MNTYEIIISKLINNEIIFKSNPFADNSSDVLFTSVINIALEGNLYNVILEEDSITLKEHDGIETTITLDKNNNILIHKCLTPEINPFAYDRVILDDDINKISILFRKAIITAFKNKLLLKTCLSNINVDHDLLNKLFTGTKNQANLQSIKNKAHEQNQPDYGIDSTESYIDDLNEYHQYYDKDY